MPEHRTVTAAVCQFDARRGAVDDNMAAALGAVFRAADKGADLIVLPELWSCGFDNENMAAHAKQSPQLLEQIADEAAKKQVFVAGSLPEAADGHLFNTCFLIDAAGHIAARYRKIHLFPMMGEDRCFSPGSQAVVCRTPLGNLGLMVCYDLRFPELATRLANEGAELILHPVAFTRDFSFASWHAFVTTRAMENQLYWLSLNRAGARWGQSLFCPPLVDDDHSPIALGSDEAWRWLTLEKQAMREARERLPLARDRRDDLEALPLWRPD